MAKAYLALLALGATSVYAEPLSTPVPIQPSVDSAEQRQALRKLSMCLVQARPRWARQTLAHPYLSDAQANAATLALSGRDSCIVQPEVEVTFRTSGLVGNLAEHFLRAEMEKADPARLAAVLSTLTPLNVSEDFALCVAARNPAAARDLALAEPGSAAETQAAEQVAVHIRPCTNQGEQLEVNLQSLRALMSIALYRSVTNAQTPRTHRS